MLEQNQDMENERERFARVWKRVMPTVRPDSPIALWPEETAAVQPQLPEGRSEANCNARQDDFPTSVSCLGEVAARYGELLQDMTEMELKDWRFYQSLARRGGIQARVFSALAADAWRHAKRLAAAHFLSSGLRYWPEPSGTVPIPSYLGALRQRFIAEQNGAAAYLAAAAGCEDPCLRQLFLEHAEDACDHAALIRGVVEQL